MWKGWCVEKGNEGEKRRTWIHRDNDKEDGETEERRTERMSRVGRVVTVRDGKGF